ncbi:MAG: hypothetical protein K2K23_00440 [Muribaculaceae bacterium]|nr:hypothetical protein [Muribaculaceae bacterium]
MEKPKTNIITFARTSISAGLIIGTLLSEDPYIAALGAEAFPVVTDEASLPYASFRALKMENSPTKGIQGSDTLFEEVCCFSDTYAGSVELAECVRSALDGRQGYQDGIRMRSCFFEDREESWQDDAYVQRLIFRIKI